MDFNEFFRTESDRLLRLCWLLTLEREAAADLAQDVMQRAWERWDQLGQPGQHPQAWARTVAVNLSNSRWRRMKRLTERLPRLVDSRQPVRLSDPDLAAALATLPPRQRQAIALRYWADLPLRDCADAMGVSLGSMKQHLARAHDRLARELDPSTLEELTL